MQTIEILMIALALSVDAFAVSMAAAGAGRLNGPRPAVRLAFHFGLFQFLMPVIGWGAGATLERWITSVDHWVAFGLLTIVGIRMFRSAFRPRAFGPQQDPSRGLMLLTLSTAVSVDALAVGLSLGMLQIDVWVPSVIIGVVAAAMSLVGVLVGNRLHARYGRIAEAVGGVVLVLIAVKIVADHVGAS